MINVEGSEMHLDEHDSLELCKNRCYEPFETELVKTTLKPDDIALDIGAHIGYFTLIMAKRCKYVHAFEPSPMFEILRENVIINKFSNVTMYRNAVTEFSGRKIDVYVCDLKVI